MTAKQLVGGMKSGFAPVGRLDPELKGSRKVRAWSVMRSTATLLVRRRMDSPMATGRSDPLGLRKAMMDAPHTNGRTDSGRSPWRRMLTTSERSLNSMPADARRIASQM